MGHSRCGCPVHLSMQLAYFARGLVGGLVSGPACGPACGPAFGTACGPACGPACGLRLLWRYQ